MVRGGGERRGKQRSPEVEEGEVEAGTRTSRFEARLQLDMDARSGLGHRRPGSRQRMLGPAAYHRYPLQQFAAELGGLATACQRQPGPPAGIGMRLGQKGWQGGSLGGEELQLGLPGVERKVWTVWTARKRVIMKLIPSTLRVSSCFLLAHTSRGAGEKLCRDTLASPCLSFFETRLQLLLRPACTTFHRDGTLNCTASRVQW